MTRAELRKVIEKPAEKQVMFFKPHSLVETLVDEVAEMPGSLPLLSFALSALYVKYIARQEKALAEGTVIERAITKEDYQNIGGVVQSLTARADAKYETLSHGNPAYRDIVRNLMLRMVTLSSGEVTRRRVPYTELDYPAKEKALFETAIDCFSREDRLLVSGQDTLGNAYVEPAHDVLVSSWGKLRSWIDEKGTSADIALQRDLTEAANEWKRQKQPKFLWHANARFDVIKEKLADNKIWFNCLEKEFVERSVSRRKRNVRTYIGLTLAVISGLTALSISALIGQRDATIGQIRAELQATESALSANRFTLDTLGSSLLASQLYDSLQDEWQDHLLMRLLPTGAQLDQATAMTLFKSFYLNREESRQQLEPAETVVSAFVEGEQTLAVVRVDAENQYSPPCVRNLTIETEKSVIDEEVVEAVKKASSENLCQTMPPGAGQLEQAKFSPDGKKVAFVSEDGSKLYVWDRIQAEVLLEQPLSAPVTDLLFSPDNRSIGFIQRKRDEKGNFEQTLYQLDWQSNWQLNREAKRTAKPISLSDEHEGFAYEQDGSLVLITSKTQQGKTVLKRWKKKGRDWKHSGSFAIGFAIEEATAIAFGNGASQLAVGDANGGIRVYGLDEAQPIEIGGHQGLISSLTFSQNGKQLLSRGVDGSLRRWYVGKGIRDEQMALVRVFSGVQTLTFSPDRQRMVTLEDGTIRVWNIQAINADPISFSQHSFPPDSNLVFHPDSQQLAIASPSQKGGTDVVRLDLSSGQATPPIHIPEGAIRAMSFKGNEIEALVQHNAATSSDSEASSVYLHTIEENGAGVAAPLSQLSRKEIWHAMRDTDGQLMVVASDRSNRTLEIWDAASDEQLATYRFATSRLDSDNSNRLSSGYQSRLIAAQYGTLTQLWDWRENHSIFIEHSALSEEESRPRFSQISPDGSMLAVVDAQDNARLYSLGDYDTIFTAGCDQFSSYLLTNPEQITNEGACDEWIISVVRQHKPREQQTEL